MLIHASNVFNRLFNVQLSNSGTHTIRLQTHACMHAASNARTSALLLSFLPLPLIMMGGGRHDVDDDVLDDAGRERCGGGGREALRGQADCGEGCALLLIFNRMSVHKCCGAFFQFLVACGHDFEADDID